MAGSVVVGFIGIAFGLGLSKLELFESQRGSLIAWLFSAFGLVTILTMLAVVLIASFGIKILPTKMFEKYSHAMAGGTILMCGLGMVFLGL